MSVPLPSRLKEIYEPQIQRFLANPAHAATLNDKRFTTFSEGVSVYRTPASVKPDDPDLYHLFDGGLERVPNSEILSEDNTKLMSFLQNPSSHFEKLSSPVYYRMVD